MTHGIKILRTSATDICGTLLIGSTKSLSVHQERRSPEIVYSSHECERDGGEAGNHFLLVVQLCTRPCLFSRTKKNYRRLFNLINRLGSCF